MQIQPNGMDATQLKTYELERRIQQMEERCGELKRTQDAILKMIKTLQRKNSL
jgi:hypothetical protein